MSSIAIDVGGTYVKAATLNRGKVGTVHRFPIPAFLVNAQGRETESRSREIDPLQLDAVVFRALNEVAGGGILGSTIYISGQMAGLAYTDDLGNALAPLITWQDSRFRRVEQVRHEIGPPECARLGDGLRIGSPVVTLSEHGRPDGSFVTSMINYVAGRVSGFRAPVIHVTDAAALGLLDTVSGKWSRRACKTARVSSSKLPEVVDELRPLTEAVSVYTPIADQQASLLGAGLRPNWLSINLATGCQVSVLTNDFPSSGQVRPYFGEQYGGRFLRTVTHLPAGRGLAAALVAARGFEDWDWLNSAEGEGFPAFEEISCAINEAASKLEARGLPVAFSGGLVQNLPHLREKILASLGKPEWVMFSGDDAALAGLARLAD